MPMMSGKKENLLKIELVTKAPFQKLKFEYDISLAVSLIQVLVGITNIIDLKYSIDHGFEFAILNQL
jgi:hypothetical protein